MAWHTGIPAARSVVPGTGGHRVEWRHGAVRLVDHGAGDLVLHALGGDACPCLDVLAVAGPAAADASLMDHAELLGRLSRPGDVWQRHLAPGQAAAVRRRGLLGAAVRPDLQRVQRLATVHGLAQPVLDRVALGHLVGAARRPTPPAFGWPVDRVLGARVAAAARQVLWAGWRTRADVHVRVADQGEPASARGGGQPGAARVELVVPLAWLWQHWWHHREVDRSVLRLSTTLAVRAERSRRGLRLEEVG